MSCASSDARRGAVPAVFAALALLSLGACASLRADLPEDFLRLQGRPDELRAVTADDAILWVREFEDAAGGDLGFWTDALRGDLVGRRGYEPVGAVEPITDGTGREGALQQFRTRTGGETKGYLIAVFVIGSGATRTIRTAEFVAAANVFDERVAAVRAALATLTP